MQYIGEIFLYPVIDGRSIAGPSTGFQYFFPCDGATLPVSAASPPSCAPPIIGPAPPAPSSLAALLGADVRQCDATFTLPDLAPPIPGVGWFISNMGAFPTQNDLVTTDYPVLGAISVFPDGRMLDPSEGLPCDGRPYPAAEFPELHSLIGTSFGDEGDDALVVPDIPPPGPKLHFMISTTGAVPQLVPTT